MTALVTLQCDECVKQGRPTPARIMATYAFVNATDLRKAAQERAGWKSVVFKHVYRYIHQDSTERVRTQGERHDYCEAHKHLIPKKLEDRKVYEPTIDYRKAASA